MVIRQLHSPTSPSNLQQMRVAMVIKQLHTPPAPSNLQQLRVAMVIKQLHTPTAPSNLQHLTVAMVIKQLHTPTAPSNLQQLRVAIREKFSSRCIVSMIPHGPSMLAQKNAAALSSILHWLLKGPPNMWIEGTESCVRCQERRQSWV